jgi:hypothetical protein
MLISLLRREKRSTPHIRPNIIGLIKLQRLKIIRKILKLLKSFNGKRKMKEVIQGFSGSCSF